MARPAHFVAERAMTSWSGTSCSMPRPTPIWSDGIWPAMHNTGELQAYAVETPPAHS